MDEKPLLERAARAVGVAVVVDRRPSRVDACLQRLDDRVAQRGRLRPRDPVGGTQGVDLRPEQRLVGVDVPDAGDPLLVEQHRLDRRPTRARQREHAIDAEAVPERLDPQSGGEERVERVAADGQLARAEAARVDEDQAVPVVEIDVDSHHRRAGERPIPPVEEQRPRHPQVPEQVNVAGQLEVEVLPAPAHGLDPAALHRRNDLLGRERLAPPRVVDAQPGDPPPLHARRKRAADGLDLG